MEKIYSDVTKKFYLTKEAKELEEKAYQEFLSEKEVKEKKEKEEKVALLKKIDEQRKAMNAEIDKYNELINQYNAKYANKYHQTISVNLKRPVDIFDILMNDLFR